MIRRPPAVARGDAAAGPLGQLGRVGVDDGIHGKDQRADVAQQVGGVVRVGHGGCAVGGNGAMGQIYTMQSSEVEVTRK